TGTSEGIGSLQGNGSLDIPTGRLYNLPLLFNLLKALSLKWPDRTAFEEAHASFKITGPRVNVSRLDLQGEVISLHGKGELNLDGSDIQLDFFTDWAKVEQLFPGLLSDFSREINKRLLKIEMRGKVGNVVCTKKPVPVLVDPLLNIRDKIT